ncbi:N-acyl homoserine lactonase family protein [Chloroflexota bacterium]
MVEHVIRPIPLEKSKGMTYKFTYLVGYGSPDERVAYSWYIEGPKEKILVDTGCEAAGLQSQPVMFPMDGKMENIQSIEQGLGRFGLKPEDIDIIILTHMHEDHIQAARKYPNARFIVQKAELEMARNPHPIQQFTYLKDPFSDINFEVIKGDQKIVDGISVVLTPGHCIGAQSIVIDTAKGKAVITGFCCIRRNFEPPPGLSTPVIPTGILLDAVKSYDSMLKVKEMADIIVPIHDKEFLEVDRIPQ